jgi:hypothetical protein
MAWGKAEEQAGAEQTLGIGVEVELQIDQKIQHLQVAVK